MNEVLFFGGAALVIGLSYYIGFKTGLDKNLKDEVRQWIKEMTVSKMAHDHFMAKAKFETRKLFAFLGEKQPKDFKTPKIPTPEEFDSENKK
jgi:hypothetical protein